MRRRAITSTAAVGRSARPRSIAVLGLLILGLGALGLIGLCACGGTSTTTSSTPSATPTPTPSPSTAFEPWPPGTASAAQAMAVAGKYVARTHAEAPSLPRLFAADGTIDIWVADQHFAGPEAILYMTDSPTVLDWSKGSVLATAGAAAVEQIVINAGAGAIMPCLEVLTVTDGKITHMEVYGNAVAGSHVARPKTVATKPGPADDAAAAEAAVTAYYAALAAGDPTAAAALYAPDVVFQDTTSTGPAGGAEEAVAWLTKAAAVPHMTMEIKSVILGQGWAAARWVFSGDNSTGFYTGIPGATVFEVRDGKIVRQTIYYSSEWSPLS
jgi:ketosteroid isomerase-like protein